jgi:hypothetical protein
MEAMPQPLGWAPSWSASARLGALLPRLGPDLHVRVRDIALELLVVSLAQDRPLIGLGPSHHPRPEARSWPRSTEE